MLCFSFLLCLSPQGPLWPIKVLGSVWFYFQSLLFLLQLRLENSTLMATLPSNFSILLLAGGGLEEAMLWSGLGGKREKQTDWGGILGEGVPPLNSMQPTLLWDVLTHPEETSAYTVPDLQKCLCPNDQSWGRLRLWHFILDLFPAKPFPP